jgi:hypothetical protein
MRKRIFLRIRGREETAYGVINLSVSVEGGRKRLMAGRPAQAADHRAERYYGRRILRPADTPAGRHHDRPILRPADTLAHAGRRHAGNQRKSSGRWTASGERGEARGGERANELRVGDMLVKITRTCTGTHRTYLCTLAHTLMRLHTRSCTHEN